MRKLLVYIVLLMHVNTYMFFPMIDEVDVYERNGKQKDDINSLAEYIYQVLLGHPDNTPEDEDDDQTHYYQIKSKTSIVCETFVSWQIAAPPASPRIPKPEYGTIADQRTLTAAYDVAAPPPDA